MTNICVYCGSSDGADPAFTSAATALGHALASNGHSLVYGGASIGLMGTVADAVMASGGKVYGVMPQSLADKEIAHQGLTELIITSSMHERKTRMADLSDSFIALPGGLGTLEELFEMWTWAQLGIHHKPVALLNINGYYDSLIRFLVDSTASGFIKPAHYDMLITSIDVTGVLQKIESYTPPAVDKLTPTAK